MILSTGMNDIASVQAIGRRDQAGMACRSRCCIARACIRRHTRRSGSAPIQRSAVRRFRHVPVGLSDHSMNIWTCLGAVALGASILEKHFTISRSWPGPDTGISIEPGELKDLIEGSARSGRPGAAQDHPAGRAAGDRIRLCDSGHDRADQGRGDVQQGQHLGEASRHRIDPGVAAGRCAGQARRARPRRGRPCRCGAMSRASNLKSSSCLCLLSANSGNFVVSACAS